MKTVEAIKPGPKPKKQDGTLDKRRRDNKDTPGNKPSLKPSKSTKNNKCLNQKNNVKLNNKLLS